jgi:hypothetical protein
LKTFQPKFIEFQVQKTPKSMEQFTFALVFCPLDSQIFKQTRTPPDSLSCFNTHQNSSNLFSNHSNFLLISPSSSPSPKVSPQSSPKHQSFPSLINRSIAPQSIRSLDYSPALSILRLISYQFIRQTIWFLPKSNLLN